jgi:hypothetical protein
MYHSNWIKWNIFYMLPTQQRLKDKGVDCDPLCALCHEETALHLFFQCSSSGECWRVNGLMEDINGSMQSATHLQQLILLCSVAYPRQSWPTLKCYFGVFGNKGTMKFRTTLVRNFSRFLSVLSEQGRTGKWRSTQTKIGFDCRKSA